MGLYAKYILPGLIEWACSSEVLGDIRREVIPRARGKVLEIGIGSGNTLELYDNRGVSAVTGIDPSEVLWERRTIRTEDLGFKVDFVHAPAEDMPFESHAFDSVVSTYAFCSVKDPEQVLREVLRVLKPGGGLFIAEHGLAPDHGLARFQHCLNPLWRTIGGGCNLNRNIRASMEAAGFDVSKILEGYQQGWRATSYLYWGVARHPD